MNRYIEYTNGDSITYFTISESSNNKSSQTSHSHTILPKDTDN